MAAATSSDAGGTSAAALRALSDAVLAIAAERSVDSILQRIVDSGRRLVRARYGALGTPDGQGGFAKFIVSGIGERRRAAIGELPRTHGLLGAMLQDPTPLRLRDIESDPRFGWWPRHHPRMTSFLGVPIVSKGRIIGAFYLADKRGAPAFTRVDQQLIEMLAAHAAVAMENARLHERGRELTVMEERNRLARELHDSVSQTLFSAVFTAEAAATLIDRDPARAREEVRKLRDLARGAAEQMRSLIFELRPAELEADGLVPTLRKHVEVLRRVYDVPVSLRVTGERRLEPTLERELYRIAQEALNNAIRHARAGRIAVDLHLRNGVASLRVRDDGAGFDPTAPELRVRHLGLTSMEERARSVGGVVSIESSPGRGTTVNAEAPVG